eukprot:TRINITY_DN66953_c0_g1_i1.p1 TRINITY_DN66953_c0_g1~~TRINITY_DN66953_c0_g1_i1.p1  ORF type:complete len:437 (+),score=98.77 TRINITY_DN66953_c0_g1_i1:76-1386(+)
MAGPVIYYGRQAAMAAAGIGVAAGTLGTWFEMSHGVFCIPVLSLPPLALTQQVSTGSTVFGVAARQILSVALYSTDPSAEGKDLDAIHELIDVNAAAALAISGSLASMAGAAMTIKMPQKGLRRLNGLFLVGAAVFCQWREQFVAQYGAPQDEDEREANVRMTLSGMVPETQQLPTSNVQHEMKQAEMEVEEIDYVAPAPETTFQGGRFSPGPSFQSAASDTGNSEVPRLMQATTTPLNELHRFVVLGSLSGVVLGAFGIGPAWMLAPLVTRTSPAWEEYADEHAAQAGTSQTKINNTGTKFTSTESVGDYLSRLPGYQNEAVETDEVAAAAPKEGAFAGAARLGFELIGPSGSDDRSRRTCTIAMVPPCLAAAWRHFSLGHVPEANNIAFPLAAGAIVGSAICGAALDDIPVTTETRFGLTMLLFLHGSWLFLRP